MRFSSAMAAMLMPCSQGSIVTSGLQLTVAIEYRVKYELLPESS